MYDPTIGRFINLDPIGFNAGDANLYRYVGNRPIVLTDPLGLQAAAVATQGKVLIEVISPARAIGTGGEATFKVKFHIASPNADGWLIQHVMVRATVTDCEGKAIPKTVNRNIEYSEAWQVLKSRFDTTPVIYSGHEDGGNAHVEDILRTASEGKNRRGTIEIIGWVKFIPGYSLDTTLWKDGSVPNAGSLPAMLGTPPGWTDQGATAHRLTVTFDNCGECKPPSAKAIGIPSKSDKGIPKP